MIGKLTLKDREYYTIDELIRHFFMKREISTKKNYFCT